MINPDTEQKLVTGHNRMDWQNDVNKLLSEGWRVVPTTMQAGVSSYNGGLHFVFTVVLERYKAIGNL